MLIAGVLKFDPQGRVILSLDAAVDFNGGTPIAADGGLAAAPGSDPDVLLAGIGYLNDERITDSDNPLVPNGGPITNNRGQIRIQTGLPVRWYAGLPLTEDGYLAVSPGIVPPPDLGAFNSAFNDAFDIGSP